jgi:DNA mismatch endonuclease (patch repair protein)
MRPFESTPQQRAQMSRRRSRDTAPELALRSALFKLGLRFYVHRRPVPELRRAADIVFPRSKVAVLVDGCFWHGCPEHGNTPRANAWYWPDKIARNKSRDADTNARLEARGWTVIRVWEHEDPELAATRIHATLEELGR